MIRKAVVLLFAALMLVATASARAQTNYPADGTIEVRDENGRVVSGNAGLRPGENMHIYAEGWVGPVDLYFLSDPIFLGTKIADANGVIRAVYPVPDVEPGMHTLRLIGTSRTNGQPRTVDYPIRVLPANNSGGGGSNGGGSNGGGSNGGGSNGGGSNGGGSNSGGSNTGGSSGGGTSGGTNGGTNNPTGTGGSGTGTGTGSGGTGTGSNTNVLGSSLNNTSGGAGAFGKTGAAQAREIAAVGFAIFAVGAALVLAVRRSRDAAHA